MKMISIELRDFQAFQTLGPLPLGAINVFVGANKRGKSGVVRAITAVQDGLGPGDTGSCVRKGSPYARALFGVDAVDPFRFPENNTPPQPGIPDSRLQLTVTDGNVRLELVNGDEDVYHGGFGLLPGQEPRAWIYPFLSKRKVSGYSESVNLSTMLAVEPSLTYIVSKLQRLTAPTFPHYEEFRALTRELLGFEIGVFASGQGQKAGMYVSTYDQVALESMGEGVASILGLAAELTIADGNLFVLEEPENDIHPKALKQLCRAIVEKSRTSQFIVTTHSNVVLRHLGAGPDTRVFAVSGGLVHRVPTSTCSPVEDPAGRLKVLDDLGYERSDLDLWEGWLSLEESSAERIIRDVLIPRFVPSLSGVRTLSTRGVSRVEATFDDYDRIFLYAHLEGRYHGRAWVIVDGDEPARAVI